MKACRTCGQDKPLNDYYLNNGIPMLDCRECHRTRVRNRARTNPEVQARDRARAKLPHRRENARRVSQKWRRENPDAYRAQTAVGNAVRDGRLKKAPCGICGDEKVHAHHKDYSKPLEVVWLCAKCHHRLHALFPEFEGANKRQSA